MKEQKGNKYFSPYWFATNRVDLLFPDLGLNAVFVVEARSLNHWTARDIPGKVLMLDCYEVSFLYQL